MPITLIEYIRNHSEYYDDDTDQLISPSGALSPNDRIDLAIKIVLALNQLHTSHPPQYLNHREFNINSILIDEDNHISFKEDALSHQPDRYDSDNTLLVDTVFKTQSYNTRLFSDRMDYWPYPRSKLEASELLHQLEYFRFAVHGKIVDDEEDRSIKSAEHLIYILSQYKQDVHMHYDFDKAKVDTLLAHQNKHVIDALSSVLKYINPTFFFQPIAALINKSIESIWPTAVEEFDFMKHLKIQPENLQRESSARASTSMRDVDEDDETISMRDSIELTSISEKQPSQDAHPITQAPNQHARVLFNNITTLISNMTEPKKGIKERWSHASNADLKIQALEKLREYVKHHEHMDDASLHIINKLVLDVCQHKRHSMDFRETHSSKEFKNMYSDLKDTKPVTSQHASATLIKQIVNDASYIESVINAEKNPQQRL